MDNLKTNWAVTIVAVLLGLAGLTISLTIDTTNEEGQSKKTITFHVDKSGAPGTQTGTVTAPVAVVKAVEPNLEDNLFGTPVGAPPEQVDANRQTEDETKATLPALPTAGATAGVSGCVTRFVNNQSSRNGVRPIWFVLHYTVSPNVVGWADVNSVVALFDRISSQASSTFVLDGEGHCAYIVPIERKPWTQAAGNSLSVSVEIIATGKETTLCTGACLVELRKIFRTVSSRTGIKTVQGSVYPAVGGIVQHKDGGLAWGGHIDVTPFSSRALANQILAGLRPSKKAIWIRHRKQDHRKYVKNCKTASQRKTNAKECAAIRVHARTLDKLIARK